jgi:DNA-3-methyladenine glycosylase II
MQRTDLFPLGDIALVNSLKEVKRLHPHTSKEKMLAIAEPWRPYRTIASMILWHAYIQKRGNKITGMILSLFFLFLKKFTHIVIDHICFPFT